MNRFYVINKHITELKKKPIIIGMFWNNEEQLIKNIDNSIQTKVPYNEYELLTDEEKKAFDNGRLVF